MLKSNKGYTLIEITVVVLILAVLAGIVIPNYRVNVEKTKIITKIALIKGIYDALIQVYPLRQEYPAKLSSLHVTLPRETWTYDGQAIMEKDIDSNGLKCTIELQKASTPNSLDMACHEWMFSFLFINNGGSIAPGEKFFIVTPTDRKSILSKAALSFGWEALGEDAAGSAKFRIP